MPSSRAHHALALILLTPLLAGCLVKTAADVVTAPVRVVAKGADWATTSQSEADEKRGRELRRREERLGKLQRDRDRHSRECLRGIEDSCTRAREDYAEMQNLLPTIPVEPR